MSDHLYPTLVADGLLSTHVADNCGTLQNQKTSEVDKYLQEVAERCEEMLTTSTGGMWLPIHQVSSKKLTL